MFKNKLVSVILFFFLPAHALASFAWNINFSMNILDEEVALDTIFTLKPQAGISLLNHGKAFFEVGLKLGYNNRYIFDVFSKVTCYKYPTQPSKPENAVPTENKEKEAPSAQEKTVVVATNDEKTLVSKNCHSLNVKATYSPLTLRASVSVLPVYKGQPDAYLKNILLLNFLERSFEETRAGKWRFVGYKSAQGYTSLEEHTNNLNKTFRQTPGRSLLNKTIAEELQITMGAFMADLFNNELKNFSAQLGRVWTALTTGEVAPPLKTDRLPVKNQPRTEAQKLLLKTSKIFLSDYLRNSKNK